jgi:SPOR domain
MSEQDRGAYAPQSDAPLRFDSRRSPPRQAPLALVGSAAVLLALVASLVLFYRSGVRQDGEPKQVGQPLASIKTPAPAASKPSDSAAKAIYQPQHGAQAPKFETAPEQPMSRAQIAAQSQTSPPAADNAPRGLVVQTAPGPAVKIVPAAPEKAAAEKVAPPAPKPAVATASPAKPSPPTANASDLRDRLAAKPMALAQANKPAAAPAPKPVPAKSVPAKPAYAPDTAAQVGHGAAVVQIGAFTSQELAAKGFSDVAAKMGGAMAGRGKHFEPVDVGGVTRYRAQVTGFASSAEAASFCASLKAKGHDCIVKH